MTITKQFIVRNERNYQDDEHNTKFSADTLIADDQPANTTVKSGTNSMYFSSIDKLVEFRNFLNFHIDEVVEVELED